MCFREKNEEKEVEKKRCKTGKREREKKGRADITEDIKVDISQNRGSAYVFQRKSKYRCATSSYTPHIYETVEGSF